MGLPIAAVGILALSCCCGSFCSASGLRSRPVALAHDGPPFEYEQGQLMLNAPSNTTCYNEDRIRSNGTDALQGRFFCPEEGGSAELTECCGSPEREYCCSPWDSVGVKWGIGIGITLAVIVLMALGYTVQLFRACDRCYHEFPILSQPGT
uniref:CX domain-containing protein n=1 Tax=Macrostomum lignano TaxID=282301 RepID=A0A1I8I898_9PLAT